MKNILLYATIASAIFLLLISCGQEQGKTTKNLPQDSIKATKRVSQQVKDNKYPFQIKEKGVDWTVVDTGLYLTEIDLPKSPYDNSKATIVKINPNIHELQLLCAKVDAKEQMGQTAKEWAEEKDLLMVVNAGMFDGKNTEGEFDGYTNRGLMKNKNYTNNNTVFESKTMKAVLAFQPKTEGIPPVKIIDLVNENLSDYIDKYHCYSQCLRLVDIKQKNVYPKNNLMWSMIVVAVDKSGHLLFIFTRSPYTMWNHINTLLKSPLDIYNMMYLEGGPETSLYLNHNGTVIQKFGSFETNFYQTDNNNEFWDLPNVLAIKRKLRKR